MAGNFFDTNVLLYLTSGDNHKADQAEAILAGGGSINIQVLNEFVNVARRKMKLSFDETNDILATLRRLLNVEPLTLAVHDRGVALAERYRLSIYDAMIIAAALSCNCDVLLSEDMQNGQKIEGGLRIVNPFIESL